jgi:hypothetical protein
MLYLIEPLPCSPYIRLRVLSKCAGSKSPLVSCIALAIDVDGHMV